MSLRSPLIIRVAERILSEEHHCLIGDLEWTYREWAEQRGRVGAFLWLWGTLLILVPRLLVRDLIWQHTMLRSYLTVAIRQLNKFKAFSAINVLGLALSMSVCLLMLAIVQNYRSFDNFHPDGDRLYRVTSQVEDSWGRFHVATSSRMVSDQLLSESDDIELLVRMRKSGGQLVRQDGRVGHFNGLYAEPSFFDLFGYTLEQGNPRTALENPMTMVITRTLADRLFPDVDPVGQTVERESGTYEITGVVAETAGRSHLRFDALVSFSSLPAVLGDDQRTGTQEWTVNTAYYTYFRVREGSSTADIERLLASYPSRFVVGPDAMPTAYTLQPVTGINMGLDLSNEIGPVVPRSTVLILSFLAFILIGTAVFNYMNLTVSRSLRRSQELGVRKVIGAHRRQLIQQFVTESIVTSVLSLGLAVLFLQWLIPGFNSLGSMSEEGMGLSTSFMDPGLLLTFLGFALLVGIVAGLLPALRVSRVSPVAAFRGTSSNQLGGRFRGRKVLVVFQFALSVVAIITVTTLTHQMDFMSQAELNLNEDELVHVTLSGVDYASLARELEHIPGIQAVAATSDIPSGNSTTFTDIRTPGMDDPVTIQRFAVDEGFIDQYNLSLVAGRGFDASRETDATAALIITEQAVTFLGLGTPQEALGQQLIFDEDRLEGRVEVVGVVSNFYSRGFDEGYVPVALTFAPELAQFAALRISPVSPSETLAAIESVWALLAPGLPLDYQFFDDAIQAQLDQKKADTNIIGLFGLLIIVIACLGLLGMAMFSAESRLKEVGVRKTLGADTIQVVRLLSAEYVRLIVIAILLAAPIAWWLNDMVLSNFANRIAVGPGILLMGVLPVAVLALVTIGSQTLRAAMSNPVDVMRAD